ncbi:MAG: SymE family type I addiction module toxin [Leclercia sp.]
MAAWDFKPDYEFAQTNSESSPDITENREVVRKNRSDRLHGKETFFANVHPRAATPEESAACCELYSRIGNRHIHLTGDWLARAGFINGMPVKIRVMKDCIVITPQHTRELWGCLEGMSVTFINKKRVSEWLKTFPGALNDTGDVPVIKRGL